MTLLAFAAERRPCSNRSISPPGPEQQIRYCSVQRPNDGTERQTDRRTDRQTDRQTDRRTDRQTDRQTDGRTDARLFHRLCSTYYASSVNKRHTHTYTHPFNGPLSGTTRVSWYQKGETNLDFTEARDSEWQWHQLGHMQVCTSLQTDNHTSTPPLSFLQAGCPSCRPTNSVRALKAMQCQ